MHCGPELSLSVTQGRWDEEGLALELAEIQEPGFDLRLTGHTCDEKEVQTAPFVE
jgi:hypothetical protein